MLRECMDHAQRHFDVQIFGSDLDAKAIETVRSGQYPDGIAVDVLLSASSGTSFAKMAVTASARKSGR
jgi:chemotaxis methyl-accepting protein methylase